MNKKLWFLTKMSLKKKIKTKSFLIANLIFLILIIVIANIDSVIKLFGGDFSEHQEIMIIDRANVFNEFEKNFLTGSKYISDFEETSIIKYNKSYDEGIKEIEDNKHKILLLIEPDMNNYLKAKVVSKEALGTITNALINTSLTTVRSGIALSQYKITREEFNNIQESVELEKVVLSDNDPVDNMMVSTIMQIITIPIFFLIMYLVQMIGAEVNEEKSTRSMEIIISNVSPKTHFMSKVIASNAFVFFQGILLVFYGMIAILIRFFVSGGDLLKGLGSDIVTVADSLPLDEIVNTFHVMIPVMLIMVFLTFIAYSLLAGILASMTTNMEDYQQLQTPIIVVLLAGYYFSLMSGMFKGSIFIKIMCYIPLVSSMLAPTLYVMGEITIFDLIGSILLLIGLIYLLIKYGLRIYKAGILNYSGTGLWKKMFKAIKVK